MGEVTIQDLIFFNRYSDKPVTAGIKITDLIDENYPKNIVRGKIKITDLIEKNAQKESKKEISEKSLVLLCDSPSCRLPIRRNVIAFSPRYKEMYHPGKCITYAMTVKAFNSGEMVFANINYITRKEALKIKFGLEAKTK